MKRFHVHISVESLADSIRYYSALFHQTPSVEKTDYAKWMLDDPRVNFAISQRGQKPGLDHLGFQVESDDELSEINSRLVAAEMPVKEEKNTACCYAESDKYWSVDPQGIAWEAFHTLANIPTFNGAESLVPEKKAACCPPVKEQVKKGCC